MSPATWQWDDCRQVRAEAEVEQLQEKDLQRCAQVTLMCQIQCGKVSSQNGGRSSSLSYQPAAGVKRSDINQ